MVKRRCTSRCAAPSRKSSNSTLAKLLLEFKADPNVKDNGGYTPLYWGSFSQYSELAKVLLAGGAPKKRYALKHSKVMIHQPHGGVGGQVSDIEIQANEIVRTRQALNEIMADHTGKTAEDIAKACDRDYYMTATEAMEYGIVDNILLKPPGVEDEEDED